MAPKVKKGARRSLEKYSTPLVGEAFDTVSQVVLARLKKNGKAAAKWMGKMKLSIQRKVQSASRVAFVSEGKSPEHLRAEIDKLRDKIRKQTATIRDAAKQALKKVALKEPVPPSTEPLKTGKFEARVKKIGDAFGQVAKQLEKVGKDMHTRLDGLTGTLTTVQSGWSKTAHSQAAAPAGAKRGPGRASAGGKTKGQAASASPDASQLAGLHKHLDKA